MDTPKIITEMTENEKRVLGQMDWERGTYYRDLEEETGLKKSELKKIIKKLKDLKLIFVGSLVGEEGGYYGRGWTLSGFGSSMKNNLEEKYL